MCLPVEPFKIERQWEHAGLTCAVVLACEAGHRCGYVRVPPGHPAFGKEYDAIDVEVHGGLTFAELEPCKNHPEGQGYWLGFDTAHCGDAYHDPAASPDDLSLSEETRRTLAVYREIKKKYPTRGRADHYWTQSETERETEKLAEQLAASA